MCIFLYIYVNVYLYFYIYFYSYIINILKLNINFYEKIIVQKGIILRKKGDVVKLQKIYNIIIKMKML